MRIRHRTPSIFNLSMVDVLCCALGCVILPLLYYLYVAQEYKDQTEQYRNETERQNQQSAEVLASVTKDRDGAYQMLLEIQGALKNTTQDKTALDAELTRQKARVLALEKQLAQANDRQALTSKDLETLRAVLEKERLSARGLEKDRATMQDRLNALQVLVDRLPAMERDLAASREKEKMLGTLLRTRDGELAASRDKEKEASTALRLREADLVAMRSQEKQTGELLRARDVDLADLARRVQALTTDKATLEKNLAAMTGDKTVLEKTVTAGLTRTNQLEKELAATIRTLLNLQDEKKALEAKAAKAKAASDARFAGVELSGRRVVFLVDTSLSMIETADGKPFPEKWAGVADTVAKVMQSLPELEAYQLILFSSEASFPLGQSGEWLRYDAASSPDLVKRTLLDPKHKPAGGTNMYAGLENAFKMRSSHLDTIYLFSDGLPSRGAGVDLTLQKTLSDTELARRLGDHVREALRTEWNQPLQNLPRVRIHSIGFFYASPDVGAFLWSLSRENDGSFVGMSRP